MTIPQANYQGPTDSGIRSSNISGYSQVSRIGEQVVNAFVDAQEYGVLNDSLTLGEAKGETYFDPSQAAYVQVGGGAADADQKKSVEAKPYFHEWATAYVGMIAVSRRMRSNFKNHMAAESASPVVVCAGGKGPLDEADFMFQGVVRSNSVRTMDDGVGPTVDEYFTLTTSGMVTLHNTSDKVIHNGDAIAWTFESTPKTLTAIGTSGRLPSKGAPRRIGIRVADFHDENVIGRALSAAKPGGIFDATISIV
mgnify:CR=1 FL=1